MGRTKLRKGDGDTVSTDDDIDEEDKIYTPFGILCKALDDDEVLAAGCLSALAEYAAEFPIGNNQAAAIVFFDVYEAVFGCIDLWDEADKEEVM
jgi:hypothetical protein